MEHIKVFLSSTVRDLENERTLVKEILEEMQLFEVFASEADAAYGSPIMVCMQKVSECDLFILVIGERYGYIPDEDKKHNTPYDGKKSATHGEFLRARELQKPLLVFVKDAENREASEEQFYRNIGSFIEGNFAIKFSGTDSLKAKLIDSISGLLVDLIRNKYMPQWKHKPNVIIAEDPKEVAQIGSMIMGYTIINRPHCNIGLFAGRTAERLFPEFLNMFDSEDIKDIINTKFYSVTEHFGISPDNRSSYHYFFNEAFFLKVKEHWGLEIPAKNIRLVPSSIEQGNVDSFRREYDQMLNINRVDVQFMSPAPDGQFISIDPCKYSLEDLRNMGTSLVEYSSKTADYLVPKSPHDTDITIGMRNLLGRSEQLVIMAFGKEKIEVVRRMLLGPIDSDSPASLVSLYPTCKNLLFIIDRESAEGLPKTDIAQFINIIDPRKEKWWRNCISNKK